MRRTAPRHRDVLQPRDGDQIVDDITAQGDDLPDRVVVDLVRVVARRVVLGMRAAEEE